jgi:hypothetical protein
MLLLVGTLGSGLCLAIYVGANNDQGKVFGRDGGIAFGLAFGLGLMLLIGAVAWTPPLARPALWRSFAKRRRVAWIMLIPTAILFGPTGGLHHNIGFGPLIPFYMTWSGERNPGVERFQIVTGYEVWFNPWMFALLLVIWCFMFQYFLGWVEPKSTHAKSINTESSNG